MAEQPLSGVRVLEIGGGIAAAYATRWMAGFGADVVRTEGPADELSSDEQTYLLPGKRRIAVTDDALHRLALTADIIVEDQRPGALARRGLDPLELRRGNPAAVIVSLTPFGQDGPYADYPQTNITIFAMGGIMGLTGEPAPRPPLQTGGSQALYLGGLNGFSSAVTAYFGALVHGEGDWLDISLQECAAGMLEAFGPRTEYHQADAYIRAGNQLSSVWGIYPVADGFGGVCCLQRQVPALLRAVGEPELMTDRFIQPAQRAENDDELRAYLYPWFLSHTKAELLAIGRDNRIPLGAVLTPADLLENRSLAERGYFDTVDTPEGQARIPGRPLLGFEWQAGDLHGAGDDTDAVLADWLGGDEER